MSKKNLILLLALFSFVPEAHAYQVVIDTGVHTTIPGLMAGILNLLLEWSGVVAVGLFLLGCMLMIGSGGSDQYLSAGKRIMKASLIGFTLILASWLILSTAVFFITG